MHATTFLYLLLFFGFNNNPDCKKLSSGNYLVKHTLHNGAEDYRLKINAEAFTIVIKDTLIQGKINWLGDCIVDFKRETTREDTSALGQKIKNSFGYRVIELKNSVGDTTYFRTTYSHNMHITVNEGYFLRISLTDIKSKPH